MITRAANLTACWLPLESCSYVPDEHGIGLDEAQVLRYAALLREQPEQATDPIVVVAECDGRYRITNGRHRWLAAHLAGRQRIAAVVVDVAADVATAAPRPLDAPADARLTTLEHQLQRLALRAVPADDLNAALEPLRAEIATLRSRLATLGEQHETLAKQVLFGA